ncbi:hypothetical protein ES703_44180 [subsurface metagenome]
MTDRARCYAYKPPSPWVRVFRSGDELIAEVGYMGERKAVRIPVPGIRGRWFGWISDAIVNKFDTNRWSGLGDLCLIAENVLWRLLPRLPRG